jgi:uncharacterized protein (UPF0548 family)
MVRERINQPGVEQSPDVKLPFANARSGSKPSGPIQPLKPQFNPRKQVQSIQPVQWQPITDHPAIDAVDFESGDPMFDPTAVAMGIDLTPAVPPLVSAPTPIAVPRIPRPRQILPKQTAPRGWSLVWLGTFCLFGGMGMSAYLWLTGLPPLPNCKTVTPLSSDIQRLYCAQEIARSGQLADVLTAMTLLEQWSPDHPLYKEAQQTIANWSTMVLLAARDKMLTGDLQGAVTTAKKIPSSSPTYKDAQAAIAQWQTQWSKGEVIYNKGLNAIKQQDWRVASEQVVELGYLDQDYWRLQQADVLSKRLIEERDARYSLMQAQKIAKGGDPSRLGEAIALVQQVAPKTYAWEEAQTALNQWSQTLLQRGLAQWQQGDIAGAIATAQQVPAKLDLPPEAHDLIQFSYASRLATADTSKPWQPKWEEIWNLLEAVAATGQISPQSPMYGQAQTSLKTWQARLQDAIQLQFADLTAGLGLSQTYDLAIAQATQITPDRPQRVQAQTLIAYWQQQRQKLEDLPYLALAQTWAASGHIPDLKLAIAQASQIPSGRALWQDAQTQITAWNRQIQTIEDQPILDKATALAKQGKLPEAIDVAAKIAHGRALYDPAQAAIGDWQATIRNAQIAEDQPILDRANALAAKDRLSMAIDVASQIAPGRALYNDAQASIAIWKDARESIWKTWATDSTASPSATPSSSADGSAASSSDQSTPADQSAGQPAAPDSSPPSEPVSTGSEGGDSAASPQASPQ